MKYKKRKQLRRAKGKSVQRKLYGEEYQRSKDSKRSDSSDANTHPVLQLQRLVGNQATIQMLESQPDSIPAALQREWVPGIIPEQAPLEDERAPLQDAKSMQSLLASFTGYVYAKATYQYGAYHKESTDSLVEDLEPFHQRPGVAALIDSTRAFFTALDEFASLSRLPAHIAELMEADMEAGAEHEGYGKKQRGKLDSIGKQYRKSKFKNRFSKRAAKKRIKKHNMKDENNNSKYAREYQKLGQNKAQIKTELLDAMRAHANWAEMISRMNNSFEEMVEFIKDAKGVDRLQSDPEKLGMATVEGVMQAFITAHHEGYMAP